MPALPDFLSRAEEVASLLDRVAPGWDPERLQPTGHTPMPPHDLAGVLSRSSIVLLVSYFEGFLKDLVDDSCDYLFTCRANGRQLSPHFRGYAMQGHVKTLRTTDDPGKLWESLQSLISLGSAYGSINPVPDSLLPREQLRRAITSIEPRKINNFLKALGDKGLEKGPMSSNLGQRLRSLKHVRDNAVHGNEQDLQPLGYKDVVDSLDLLKQVAGALDERVNDLLKAAHAQSSPTAPIVAAQ